jgi:PAS domain S-box-containing protein
MHKTLTRQLTHFIKNPEVFQGEWKEFLDAVSATYDSFDTDRQLIERSLEISSHEMRGFISLLQATLDSTSEGILVVDQNGLIVNHNKRFEEMWGVPEDVIDSRDSVRTIGYALEKVADPEGFRDYVSSVNSSAGDTPRYMVKLHDGRTVEINTRPQLLDGKPVGRVWSFRDVSELLQVEDELTKKLSALERLNKAMVNRELKMVELKKRIAELEKVPTI